jgi:hypothetical protein
VIGITLPPNKLYDTLKVNLFERLAKSKYQRQPIKTWPAIFVADYVRDNPMHTLSIGSFSVTDLTTRTKYLFQWPYTYGEIAREYLAYCANQANIKLRQQKTVEVGCAPVYFTGPRRGNYAYVDISACYFSLYKYLTLDANYTAPEISLGRAPFLDLDNFGQSKTIRNMAFGMMNKRRMTVFTKERYNETPSRSEYYRPDIAAYVLQTTQAVAQDSINNFPIHMWLTDAAILPSEQATEFIYFLWKEWHLQSRIVAQGSSHLLATARYKVGEKMTRDYTKQTAQKAGKCHLLMPKIDVKSLKETRNWLVLHSKLAENI